MNINYEQAEALFNDLWSERGDGQINLNDAHIAFGFDWDGEDNSQFETIVETFKELFKTEVSINVENESVNLIGAANQD